MTEITLRIESPSQADVVRLIEALDIHQGGLYRSAGYVERDAFGEYSPDPLSVFMEKSL